MGEYKHPLAAQPAAGYPWPVDPVWLFREESPKVTPRESRPARQVCLRPHGRGEPLPAPAAALARVPRLTSPSRAGPAAPHRGITVREEQTGLIAPADDAGRCRREGAAGLQGRPSTGRRERACLAPAPASRQLRCRKGCRHL